MKRLGTLLILLLIITNVAGMVVTFVMARETRSAAQRTTDLIDEATELLGKDTISRNDREFVADVLVPVRTFADLAQQVTTQLHWLTAVNVAGLLLVAASLFRARRPPAVSPEPPPANGAN